MAGNEMGDLNSAKILMKIGELSGQVQMMYKGTSGELQAIREDIARLEAASTAHVDRVEDNLTRQIAAQGEALGKRIDGVEKSVGDKISGLSSRVTALEQEDKRMIEKVAKIGAGVGGIGGALAAATIELIRHIPH